MKRNLLLVALVVALGVAIQRPALAESFGLSGTVKDCSSRDGIPFMSFRNLIPDTVVTSIIARPMSSYKYNGYTGGYFYSLADKAGLSISRRDMASDSIQTLLNPEEGDDQNCGEDLNFNLKYFGQSIYPAKCSANNWENIYELSVTVQKVSDRAPHTITLIKNICTETMFDLLPGIPTDDKIPDIKYKLSGPRVDDCTSIDGQLGLMFRNLIPGTKVVDIKARGYGNYDFEKKEWDSSYAKDGRRVLNKSFKNEGLISKLVGVDPSATLTRTEGSKQGFCGVYVNLARGDSAGSTLCDANKDNKWNNVFEFVVTLEAADGRKYAINYTKDACRETVFDIVPGTPATLVK